MVYSRKNVIKSGENATVNRSSTIKTVGLGLMITSAPIAMIAIIFLIDYLTIKIYGDMYAIVGLIVTSVMLFVPGIIMFNYPKYTKYNLLLEGCYAEDRYLRGKLNKKNREFANDAVKKARRTGRIVPYPCISTTFNAYELYKLLEKNEIVEYKVKPIIKVKYAKPEKQKTSPSYRYSNHNFDHYFTDDEFDDLMD